MTAQRLARTATEIVLTLAIVAAALVMAACGLAAIYTAAHGEWIGAAVYLLAMLGAGAAGVSLDRDLSTL